MPLQGGHDVHRRGSKARLGGHVKGLHREQAVHGTRDGAGTGLLKAAIKLASGQPGAFCVESARCSRAACGR